MTGLDLGFVHRYVEGSRPTSLLLLHGTGGDENDLLPLGHTIAPGAHLLGVRGKVLENGMPRFFRRLAMGVFDVEDLKRRTHELADFVAEAVRTYRLDADELIAVGYSNGANIAASMLFLRPDAVRKAALLHAMVPFELDDRPDLSQTSVLVTGGRRDPIVPPDHTERLARILSSCGANVSLELHPGGHELTPHEVAVLQAWVESVDRTARPGTLGG